MDENVTSSHIITPVPDPTVLTTDQLIRAIAAVREILETRLDGMDKAITLLQVTADRMPAFVDAQVANLRVLNEEKFRSIQLQFAERDTRTEQTSRDSKVAVDAALQAAKEAVGAQNTSSALAIAKSEAGTTKQIDQIITLFQTATGALDSKISDLKDRLSLIDGRGAGIAGSWGIMVAVLGILGMVGGLAVALLK